MALQAAEQIGEERIARALKSVLPSSHVDAMMTDFQPIQFPNLNLGFALREDPCQQLEFCSFVNDFAEIKLHGTNISSLVFPSESVEVHALGTRREIVRYRPCDELTTTPEKFVEEAKALLDMVCMDTNDFVERWNARETDG